MKYILMMNAPKSGWDSFMSWPPEAIKRHIEFMKEFNKKLQAQGEFVSAAGLTPPSEAKLVRAQKNGPPVIDGAFAETKEFLAGWWVVNVPNADRAYAIAAAASAAPGPDGEPFCIPIEVRAIGQAPEV
jgi:hypothetical protein